MAKPVLIQFRAHGLRSIAPAPGRLRESEPDDLVRLDADDLPFTERDRALCRMM